MVLHSSIQAAIDRWLNAAPEARRIHSLPLANDAWETKAIEDGCVVYEEVDVDCDAPLLNELAAWCDGQLKLEPRPPVKTTGAGLEAWRSRTAASG